MFSSVHVKGRSLGQAGGREYVEHPQGPNLVAES